MDTVVVVQIVGASGYGLLVLATFARSRARFLIVDFSGLVPVVVHYVLLSAFSGAALSAFYMAADAVGSLAAQQTRRVLYWLFYPATAALGWIFWQGSQDLTAIVGTALAIAARHQSSVWRIQALVAASTIGWGLYGFLVGSVGQVVFSLIYGLAAAFNAVRFLRGRRSPQRPPGS